MEINPASGIFVSRLTTALAEYFRITIVTPDAYRGGAVQTRDAMVVKTVRYGPKTCQRIAHAPGGIPVALKKQKLLWLMLPALLISMFVVCLLSARRAALIHANWSINGLVAGLVGKIIRKPVITTLRGEDVTRAEKNKLDMLILKYCLSLSKSVVCINNAYKTWLEKELPIHAKKLITIENGIDNIFINIGKDRDYSHANTVRILSIGSLIPRKSLDHIITALANIDTSNILLTIVGEGPEYNKLARLINDHNLQNSITLRGAIAPEDIHNAYKEHDIFVLTSRSEGRPNVILEAMGSGMPIIATNIGGVNEVIKHNQTGLLFDYGDIDTLRAHILLLVQNLELREKIGRAALAFIESHKLTWRCTAEKYANLYQSILV